MLFTISLYGSLIICVAGIVYRFWGWFRIPSPGEPVPWPGRLLTAMTAGCRTLASRHFLGMARNFALDVLCQRTIFRQSRFRWCMHMFLFYGFAFLVLFHAMDEVVSLRLDSDYMATRNPYLLLRNLAGIMVCLGLAMALYRRFSNGQLRRISQFADFFPLVCIFMMMATGFALEAVQIVSEPVFDEMVSDYMGSDDEQELAALKTYWSARCGVVFSQPVASATAELLAVGGQVHLDNCMECHSSPKSAVVSYPMAKIIPRTVAIWFNGVRLDLWLWHIHYLLVFAGLAWLPFSKFFHLITTPLQLMTRSFRQSGSQAPSPIPNPTNLQAMDACTHCGACSLHCKVGPIFQVIANETILPSEKLNAFRHVIQSGTTSRQVVARLSEGAHICTECGRCQEVCSSGIDLLPLWRTSKHYLKENGFPEPHGWIMDQSPSQWADQFSVSHPRVEPSYLNLTDNPETFSGCIQCTVCTSVCPVVALADDPQQELDLTPQQIMNLMRLEMKSTALGARMIWKCVTCYLCQEHCPQGVKVADVMYELRNLASQGLEPAESKQGDS